MKRKILAALVLSGALLSGSYTANADITGTLVFPNRTPQKVTRRGASNVICPSTPTNNCNVSVTIHDNGTITATVNSIAVDPKPYVDPTVPPNANNIATKIGADVCSGAGAPTLGD